MNHQTLHLCIEVDGKGQGPRCTWPQRPAAGTCAVSTLTRASDPGLNRSSNTGFPGPGRVVLRQRRRRRIQQHPECRVRPPARLRHAYRDADPNRDLDRWLLQHAALHSVCERKAPIDPAHAYWTSVTEKLARTRSGLPPCHEIPCSVLTSLITQATWSGLPRLINPKNSAAFQSGQ